MILAIIGCFVGSFAGVLLGNLVWGELTAKHDPEGFTPERIRKLRKNKDFSDIPEIKDFSEGRRRMQRGEKMTNKEAVEQLNNLLAVCKEPLSEAVRMAISALEKQMMPRRPYVFGSIIKSAVDSYECPNCGKVYDLDLDGKLKFCRNCGQAFGWTDDI